eukprot:28491_1
MSTDPSIVDADTYKADFDILMQKIGISDEANAVKLWRMVKNIATQETNDGNDNVYCHDGELNTGQKLRLAERANEVYRTQINHLQDHKSQLRELILNKENIIENLMLRYDLGLITQRDETTDAIDQNDLERSAEALAHITLLENHKLRETVNEQRQEQRYLRDEIYELTDKINRQALMIDKLEKTLETMQDYEPRLDHMSKLLNAYALDESFPIDRRDMHGDNGDVIFVCGYIRNELEAKYKIHILIDVKHLIAKFAAKIEPQSDTCSIHSVSNLSAGSVHDSYPSSLSTAACARMVAQSFPICDFERSRSEINGTSSDKEISDID